MKKQRKQPATRWRTLTVGAIAIALALALGWIVFRAEVRKADEEFQIPQEMQEPFHRKRVYISPDWIRNGQGIAPYFDGALDPIEIHSDPRQNV